MTNTPYYGYVENPILDNLELSVRADRVLRDYGRIKTLDDFMALNKVQIMALKGAGMRTWGEIKTLQKNLREGHPEVNRMLAEQSTSTEFMDLRDAFAMGAPVTWEDVHLQMGWSGQPRSQVLTDSERNAMWAVMALLRYEYADAMMLARKDNDSE